MVFPDDRPAPHGGTMNLVQANRVVARVRPWSQDPSVAFLTVTEPRGTALAVEIPTWLEQLAQAGYRRVRTSALDALTATSFQRHGFGVFQSLTVLSVGPVGLARHHSGARRSSSVSRLRWGTDALRPRRRVREALMVDRAAFGDAWCLDAETWRDAVRATPQRRVTTVSRDDGSVMAFAITGISDQDGFLQRLAVHPDHQRRGVARTLVDDALGWVSAMGVRQLLVNTANDNVAALELYTSMGFSPRSEGLVVLEAVLTAVTGHTP